MMPAYTLQEAIAMVKAGQVLPGRQALEEILQTAPKNELAWLWLAQTMSGDPERLETLAQALEINPQSTRLLEAQQILTKRLADSRVANERSAPEADGKKVVEKLKNAPPPAPKRLSLKEVSSRELKPTSRSRKPSMIWRIAGILVALTVVAVIGMTLIQLWRNQQAVELLEEMLTPVLAATTIP
jgi:hypothetical protein